MAQPEHTTRWMRSAFIAAASALFAIVASSTPGARISAGSAETSQAGADACAPCHREIVERYRTTAMARTSGPAAGHTIEGAFVHERSGVAFDIREEPG